ncbi:SET and MYND domain-containing protein 4-like isoform X2 [Periplaneta americana]|uniref:SET and MYND domain-containing protein 4-like isoform X2 n=1 Tax=Periplaneta americana TaxID=6978 RepID=UPI0037E7FF11
MSLFDSLLNTVWQIARKEEDFLTTFARLTTDVKRVEKILSLAELKDFRVTDCFSGKYETRAEDLMLLGDRLDLETAEKLQQALALYSSAIKLSPSESPSLARSYMGRAHALYRAGYADLAIEDARRALGPQLPQQDTIKLLCLIANCHQVSGKWNLAEDVLQQALETLTNSDIENDIKAALTGNIASQLKQVVQNKQQEKSKKKSKKGGAANAKGSRVGDADKPELTYGKNADIPAASSALKLCYSPDKGRYMEATRTIKLGSVLIVEQPYAWGLSGEAMTGHCLHCCRLARTPVPCAHCSTILSRSKSGLKRLLDPDDLKKAVKQLLFLQEIKS